MSSCEPEPSPPPHGCDNWGRLTFLLLRAKASHDNAYIVSCAGVLLSDDSAQKHCYRARDQHTRLKPWASLGKTKLEGGGYKVSRERWFYTSVLLTGWAGPGRRELAVPWHPVVSFCGLQRFLPTTKQDWNWLWYPSWSQVRGWSRLAELLALSPEAGSSPDTH